MFTRPVRPIQRNKNFSVSSWASSTAQHGSDVRSLGLDIQTSSSKSTVMLVRKWCRLIWFAVAAQCFWMNLWEMTPPTLRSVWSCFLPTKRHKHGDNVCIETSSKSREKHIPNRPVGTERFDSLVREAPGLKGSLWPQEDSELISSSAGAPTATHAASMLTGTSTHGLLSKWGPGTWCLVYTLRQPLNSPYDHLAEITWPHFPL